MAFEEVTESKGTILLIDDEEMILKVGKIIFPELSYKALYAGSGTEGIEVYRKNKEMIDVIILDMIMPEMDGGETYDRLKEINPAIKVLLSSGYSIDGQAEEILNRGCDGFIQKPFGMEELSQKLGEILGKA